MKLLITEPTFVQGAPAARGDLIEVSDLVGRELIHAGKAVVAKADPVSKPAPAAVTAPVEAAPAKDPAKKKK